MKLSKGTWSLSLFVYLLRVVDVYCHEVLPDNNLNEHHLTFPYLCFSRKVILPLFPSGNISKKEVQAKLYMGSSSEHSGASKT